MTLNICLDTHAYIYCSSVNHPTPTDPPAFSSTSHNPSPSILPHSLALHLTFSSPLHSSPDPSVNVAGCPDRLLHRYSDRSILTYLGLFAFNRSTAHEHHPRIPTVLLYTASWSSPGNSMPRAGGVLTFAVRDVIDNKRPGKDCCSPRQ